MIICNDSENRYTVPTVNPSVPVTVLPNDGTSVDDALYLHDLTFRDEIDQMVADGVVRLLFVPAVDRHLNGFMLVVVHTDGSGDGSASRQVTPGVLMRVQLNDPESSLGSSDVSVHVTSDYPLVFDENVWTGSLGGSGDAATNVWDHLPAGLLTVTLASADADSDYVVGVWTLPV